MDFFYTPYKKLKGNKAREERKTKRLELVNKAKEGFMDFGRKVGATNITEKLGDIGASLANKALNVAGYEEGGMVEGYKKGGKVKRKKVVKQKQKQKQNVKQNVKQVVNVKVGSDAVKRRRAYKPREKKEATQQPVSISYAPSFTPIQQDQGQYEELMQQIQSLKNEKQKALKEESKSIPVKEEEKGIRQVRERQQREYEKIVEKPERSIKESEVLQAKPPKKLLGAISLNPTVPTTYYEEKLQETPEPKKGRGRPKSEVPIEERKRQYAEKQKQKRQEKLGLQNKPIQQQISAVKAKEKKAIMGIAEEPKKRGRKKKLVILEEPTVPPTVELYGQKLQEMGGGASAIDGADY